MSLLSTYLLAFPKLFQLSVASPRRSLTNVHITRTGQGCVHLSHRTSLTRRPSFCWIDSSFHWHTSL